MGKPVAREELNTGGVAEIEEWRSVPLHLDYEVSSLGRVRCCRRRRYLRPGDLVAIQTLKSGYKTVCLDGQGRLLHRAVCSAFHGLPPTKSHEVAHNNGIRGDNVPSNLRWALHVENCADVKGHGTANPPRGEMQGRSILTASDVADIRSLRFNGRTQREIAERFGVARVTVSAILNGYNWKHTLPNAALGESAIRRPA